MDPEFNEVLTLPGQFYRSSPFEHDETAQTGGWKLQLPTTSVLGTRVVVSAPSVVVAPIRVPGPRTEGP